jgi:putative membrane protein
MMGWYGAGMGWGGWLVMGLFWLLLLGLILFLVVRLLPGGVPGASGQGGDGGGVTGARSESPESPEEILDRRFAQGEIDVETYQVQRAALAQARGRR